MSLGKSNFYCNGIPDSIVQAIAQATGMKRGSLPFRYLGVNIIPKRLGVMDCQCLVDKITERIARLGTRKLSYAGRVVLVKAVLSTLHNYWVRIFILPKTVLDKIDAMCRKFLWHGTDCKGSPALVAWRNICRTKKKGGLGLKNLHQWNIASLRKYVWWIEQKSDNLWVKWIHAIYMKNQDWQYYEPSSGASWAWRRLCGVKNILKPFLYNEQWRNTGIEYTVMMGYQWLEQTGVDVPWYPWVSNRIMAPKHEFFIWLALQQRLLTQDRMVKMGFLQSNVCWLCGQEEECHQHLFFSCTYSRKCLTVVENWLQIRIPVQDVMEWWLKYRNRSLLVRQVLAASIAYLMYEIWHARNRSRVESFLVLPTVLVRQVQRGIVLRLKVRNVIGRNRRVQLWLERICNGVN
ncbi:uncharacterized protein LOC141631816 [Silene latifolia]|uniref:uncharacterized protein LOC141631816 n=1 Tax=Silene latifolia TaxID=37657 RepID=UPI003D78360E